MLLDIHSAVAILVGHIANSRNGAALVGSTVINMGDYMGGTFILNTGTYTGSGALAAKLQYSSSATFASDIVDDGGTTGNTLPVASATASTAYRFDIKMPEDATRPYYRLACTDSVAAVVYSSEFIGRAKVTPVAYS